jgi:hypothetical protein
MVSVPSIKKGRGVYILVELNFLLTTGYLSTVAIPRHRPSTTLISNIVSMRPGNKYSFCIFGQWKEWLILILAILQKNQRLSNSLTCQLPMLLEKLKVKHIIIQ